MLGEFPFLPPLPHFFSLFLSAQPTHHLLGAFYRGPGFLTTLYPFMKLEYSLVLGNTIC
jgi:hypothetical protein